MYICVASIISMHLCTQAQKSLARSGCIHSSHSALVWALRNAALVRSAPSLDGFGCCRRQRKHRRSVMPERRKPRWKATSMTWKTLKISSRLGTSRCCLLCACAPCLIVYLRLLAASAQKIKLEADCTSHSAQALFSPNLCMLGVLIKLA